jgi:putative spermidine/putrescine transport system substrate-binding protein
VIGTSATLTEDLQRAAANSLPFPISFEVLDGQACLRRGVLNPESYDVYDQWFYSVDLLWTAGSIQAIDTQRIERWSQVRVAGQSAGSSPGLGSRSAPAEHLFVHADGTLGAGKRSEPSGMIAMLPTTYNVDSFAFSREVRETLRPGETESWSWLLDDRWHGRCTLSRDPAASAVELALAARSAGLLEVQDPADLSIEEIDALFDILLSLKRRGHFTKFWGSNEESVGLMNGSSYLLGSLWSPAYYSLRAMGRDLEYAAPQEGYRGWHSGLCLSGQAEGDVREAAYTYMNWWLGGTPGAIMARQGYYISVTEPLKSTLRQSEWEYWYEGMPAAEDLPCLTAPVAIRRGERRAGGSQADRVSRVAVWSAIMPEHNYLVRRWREFLEQ